MPRIPVTRRSGGRRWPWVLAGAMVLAGSIVAAGSAGTKEPQGVVSVGSDKAFCDTMAAVRKAALVEIAVLTALPVHVSAPDQLTAPEFRADVREASEGVVVDVDRLRQVAPTSRAAELVDSAFGESGGAEANVAAAVELDSFTDGHCGWTFAELTVRADEDLSSTLAEAVSAESVVVSGQSRIGDADPAPEDPAPHQEVTVFSFGVEAESAPALRSALEGAGYLVES